MRGRRNPQQEARICAAWQSGRYRKLIKLAHVFHVSPKAVERALKRHRLADNNYGRGEKPTPAAGA